MVIGPHGSKDLSVVRSGRGAGLDETVTGTKLLELTGPQPNTFVPRKKFDRDREIVLVEYMPILVPNHLLSSSQVSSSTMSKQEGQRSASYDRKS